MSLRLMRQPAVTLVSMTNAHSLILRLAGLTELPGHTDVWWREQRVQCWLQTSVAERKRRDGALLHKQVVLFFYRRA